MGVPGGRVRAPAREAHTTNQRMEITAAFEAVRAIDGPLEIVSDSTYVVNCFRDRWYEGWLKRGWKNSRRQPVANRDLWEPFIELVLERGDVDFRWVKGHSGDPMNDLVDRLAVEAAVTQAAAPARASRPSSARPTSPGAAARRGRDRADCPPAASCSSAGHRPGELGGYDANPVADARARRSWARSLAAMAEVDGDAHRRQRAAARRRAARRRGRGRARVCRSSPCCRTRRRTSRGRPSPAPGSRGWWPRRQMAHHARDARRPPPSSAPGRRSARRDDWLAKQVDSAVVVWDQRGRRGRPARAGPGGPPRSGPGAARAP